MGKGIIDRMLTFIGFAYDEEEEDIEQIADEIATGEPVVEEPEASRGRRGKLVSLPGKEPWRMVVIAPESFDGALGSAVHLKARRPVIINLQDVDQEMAQSLLTFLGGTIYALGGEMQRIGKGVFLFTRQMLMFRFPGGKTWHLKVMWPHWRAWISGSKDPAPNQEMMGSSGLISYVLFRTFNLFVSVFFYLIIARAILSLDQAARLPSLVLYH